MRNIKINLALLILLFCTHPLLAQLSIVSVTPEQNSIVAGEREPVRIVFSSAVDMNTVHAGGIIIHGNQTGNYDGSFSFESGTNTVVFQPFRPFKPGEIISVTVNEQLRSTGGQSISEGYQWQYTIRVEFGTGQFYDPEIVNLQPQSQPVSIYAADLNNNYFPDLATVNSETGLVTILGNRRYQDGEFGGFWIIREIETGGNEASMSGIENMEIANIDPIGRGSHITGGDMTGNGSVDLVVCNPIFEKITLLKNTGTGTYEFDLVELTTEYKPLMSVLADFNNNGLLDIGVVAMGDNRIVIHFNTGNGNFSTPSTVSVGRTPISLTARDVNNNGFIDIIVAAAGDDRVDILTNNGDGGFTLSNSIDLPFSPGILDANVLLGNEGGTYGDNYIDIAVGSRFSNQIAIIRNNQTADLFEIEDIMEVGESAISGMALADIDTIDITAHQMGLSKDRDLDIITSHFSSDEFIILENRANQMFAHLLDYNDIISPVGITAADFDLDGDIDLAVTNYSEGTVTLFYNVGGRVNYGVPVVGPTGINFGEVCLNTEVSETIPVENVSQYNLYVSIRYPENAFSTDKQEFMLSPGESETITVYFNPDEMRLFESGLLIAYSIDGGETTISSDIIPLRGRGVEGLLSASPLSIDFGVVIALQSATRSFTLQNNGNIPVEIISMETSTQHFDITTPSFNTVTPGQTRTVTIEFSPTDEGNYEDQIQVIHTNNCSVEDDTITIALQGQGEALKPDLIAEDIRIGETDIILNTTHTVTGIITNEYKDVNEPFRTVFLLENEIVGDTTISAIAIDEFLELNVDVNFTTLGRKELRMVVDYGDEIDELTKENNEASIFVNVERGTQVTVLPNPFTPNNDGYNDRAGVNFEQVGIIDPRLKIFSLDGRLLRTNTEPEGFILYWDGYDENGRVQLPGVYLFVLEDGNEIIATGTVTLAR